MFKFLRNIKWGKKIMIKLCFNILFVFIISVFGLKYIYINIISVDVIWIISV